MLTEKEKKQIEIDAYKAVCIKKFNATELNAFMSPFARDIAMEVVQELHDKSLDDVIKSRVKHILSCMTLESLLCNRYAATGKGRIFKAIHEELAKPESKEKITKATAIALDSIVGNKSCRDAALALVKDEVISRLFEEDGY